MFRQVLHFLVRLLVSHCRFFIKQALIVLNYPKKEILITIISI